ncbi:hypothetical protein LMJF_03_0310 [Leishmania major strain Friedlin]|uniref:Uncharacterized protein n=1 Tax=Leishmania major TaxID=5664 RepID=E9ACH6_LEIMA|nr:hypothetical protein LMJF_03_0310 [Leishmania major strain Friedlin]CAG9567256.1 hypothetical_protein_-_conserved [Leishmania major strain Friedlin]CBZ11993.1 hypothetical protein LMJF_03_0310 [Leishmania major strain Friedlin]|eukprot:XP_003721707.1 hypothetical protein LMJF_03_0310 [Leishmania major strain Friedlin]
MRLRPPTRAPPPPLPLSSKSGVLSREPEQCVLQSREEDAYPMQTSADSNSPTRPLSAGVTTEGGGGGNTAAAAPTGANTSGTTRTAEHAVDERAPALVAAPASSAEALAKFLAMCLDRICRLEARQCVFDTALQTLFMQAYGRQPQQPSCGQAAVGAHREDGEVNGSDAHDRELSEQYLCSRHTTSCRTSPWSHVNRPPALGGSSNSHHSDDGYDRAAAASELHSQQRCRRHRSLRYTQGSDVHRLHGADAPASSSLESTAPVDTSAAAATAAGAAAKGNERDDAPTNHSTGSQHHRHQSPGAVAAAGVVPSPSPADLANTKWKEASSGAGAGVGGGCAHAVPSATAAGNYRTTLTASAAVASGSTNEPPIISHFGSSSGGGGGGRQRQGSLVTVVSPTHTSQAEEAEAHAIAASELISVGGSSAPASAVPMSGFTWAVPVTLLSSSENSRCSTPVEFHMSARSLSEQQQQQQPPTQPSTEEWPSCISGHLAERADEITHDGPDAAPPVHPQQQQQQRGSRRHLRSSLTHLAPLADHPQHPPARLHLQPTYRKGEEREGRESGSSSRLAATALRSAGSTVTSSATHIGDELDALYHELSTPHPPASVPASSESATASGAQATGTPPRKVQFPVGTDNATAINELFAQAVQNTMETTRMKENLTVLVRSVHEEREKRRRLQRREGSAVQRLFQRVLDMSSVMLRLQRTVRRIALEASSGRAADAAGWHHHHHHHHHHPSNNHSHLRDRGADSSRSAGVGDQDEDGATCDGDVDDGESEWREHLCASFSTASVAISRSRRSGSVSGSGHRQSISDRSGNVGYAALAAPFFSSGSLSAGCERVVPAVRSPWLSSLTTQCSADVARGEAIPGRGGAVTTGTATSTPVVDGVGNTPTPPDPSGTVSFQRLAGATSVTAAAAAASAGPLLVAGSAALPKIISSSSSLHSLITASAAITTNVNTTAATTTTTTTTTASRAASATLVPQSMVSSLVSVPRQERPPSLLLSPPAMLNVGAAESKSSAVTSDSSVVPALSITDVHFGLALSRHASATEDELPAPAPDAAAAAGSGSAGPRAEGAGSSTTPDSDACNGGRSGQRSERYGAHPDGAKVTEPQKAQQHLARPPQQQQRRQDVSGESSAPSPALSSSSSQCRQREHNMRRAVPVAIATTAVPMPISGGTQHSSTSVWHSPVPPPQQQTISSRKSPASAFAGASSTAARGNSSGGSSVSARRLFDALNSEHRSGAVTGASTVVDVAAEVGAKGHGGSSGTGAVNTTVTASAASPAASLASSGAALKLTGSAASLVCRTSNAPTATALAQLASAPVTARPRPRQQRSEASVTKLSTMRREARRPWSDLIQSAGSATPRSKAAAADRRGNMKDDACGTDAAGSTSLQGCENLPTWRDAATSASPTHSSSDRSPSSHPQHSLLSSWLQSPPVRVATAAGGDDKTILSPVTPAGATAIATGGERRCRPSAGAPRSHSSSGSITSTPPRRLNAQPVPSPTSNAAVGARGASFSSPSSKFQRAQPVVTIAAAHQPQPLLQTTATSHQARKWTSIPLMSSATVSGTLPHVPMMASVQSASSFLRITPILISPSMAHPASPVSPLAPASSPSAGTGAGGSGATVGPLPTCIEQPVSPLSSTSRRDQCHRLHSSRALHFSTSSSGNNMNASLAAPCTPPPTPPHGHPPNLAQQQSRDAAVQWQHAVVLSRSATALMQTTNTLPRVVASPPSPSRLPRVAPLSASRRTKPLAPAAAAPASSQPARSGYEAKTLARAAMAPTGKTQRPSNSAKVRGKAKQAPPSSPLAGCGSAAVARGAATHQQASCSSSLVGHHPCSNPQQLADDPGRQQPQRLQTPCSAQERRSGRRARAGLPPPLSVETLSDASVSALRTSSVGTAGSMDVEKGITKGDVGDGVSGALALHNHGGGSCATLVTLVAVAGAGQNRGSSAQLHPPELIAERCQEKSGRERGSPAAAAVSSLPATPTAVAAAGVTGVMRSSNRSSNASDANVDRAAGLEAGEHVDNDDDDSFVQHAFRRLPLQQQQQQQHYSLAAASVGPASAMDNAASHDSSTSSSHTSTPTMPSPSDMRSS